MPDYGIHPQQKAESKTGRRLVAGRAKGKGVLAYLPPSRSFLLCGPALASFLTAEVVPTVTSLRNRFMVTGPMPLTFCK